MSSIGTTSRTTVTGSDVIALGPDDLNPDRDDGDTDTLVLELKGGSPAVQDIAGMIETRR